MKKASASRLKAAYVCRKCTCDDFKNSTEFTKHLRKCTGLKACVPAPKVEGAEAREELLRVRELALQIRETVDTLLKRFK